MIVQGSNNPLKIKFNASVEDYPILVVTLWEKQSDEGGRLLKTWQKADMTILEDIAYCPLLEEETKEYQCAYVFLEAKGLDENGETIFWDRYRMPVKERFDKVITLTQSGG